MIWTSTWENIFWTSTHSASRKHTYIILTPLNPSFTYIVILGFTGVYIFFLISAQKHRLWVLVEAVLTSTPNLCFEQKYEKSQNFLFDFFLHFLVVKCSVYLKLGMFSNAWLGASISMYIWAAMKGNVLLRSEDPNHPVHPRSLLTVLVVCMKKLCVPVYPKYIQWKLILTSYRECAGWSESSLGARDRRCVFWRCGSFSHVVVHLLYKHSTLYIMTFWLIISK